MKKQELIHLHGLLAEVSAFCDTRGTIGGELEAYHALDVRPTSIHRSKTDHKIAVFELVEGIVTGLAMEDVEAAAANAD